MKLLHTRLKSGTSIVVEGSESGPDKYFIKALERTAQREHATFSEYFTALIKSMEEIQREVKEDQLRDRLGACAKRPVAPEPERQERRERLYGINHVAACEGWEEDDFTAQLDRLYINGQISAAEQMELFNLKYL